MPFMIFELYGFIASTSHNPTSTFQVIFDVLANAVSLYGLFLSLIFYIKTKDARIEWYHIYKRVTGYCNSSSSNSSSNDNKSSVISSSIDNPINDGLKGYRISEEYL